MTSNTEDSRNGRRRLSEIVEAVVPFAVDERSPKVEAKQEPATDTTPAFATRTGVNALAGVSKNKLLLLGGGLAIAVLFFIFTALVGRSPKRQMAAKTPSQQGKQEMTPPTKGSVTPLMETVRNPAPDNSAGQLGPNDIRRTRQAEAKMPPSTNAPLPASPIPAKQIPAPSLASVPSFADTQQRWEEPRPYGTTATAPTPSPQSQLQSSLKEPSLIFVRSEVQSRVASALEGGSGAIDMPLLNMTPGSRIQAKLQTQVSSAVQAPVVAIVEYTYAVGDRVIVPAGARVYGELQQADPSGLVSVKFDEIELLDGAREKIDAIGTSLELGPIKGEVTGKNTGKNFLVRGAAGVGSLLATVAGNKTSAAFSEGDVLRERVAQNIGTAGDSEITNLNAKSRVVVSVPADTKIYVVFTKHEANSSELRRVTSAKP